MWAAKALLFAIISFGVLGWGAVPARAELFGFMPITSNSDGEVAQQLSVDVSAAGGVASFTFYNDLLPGLIVTDPLASSITRAYFDDRTSSGLLTDFTGISGSAGVSFAEVPSGNLPGGNDLLDAFNFSFGAEATQGKGGVANHGVDPEEYVTLTFSMSEGATQEDLIAALTAGAGNVLNAAGTLRIGIHVQGIGEDSDSFVLTRLHAPVPEAVLLGLIGLTAAGLKLRRLV